MLKKLDFEEFYKDENAEIGDGLGAVAIITPSQFVQVINLPDKDSYTGEMVDGLGYHFNTEMVIYNELFNLGIEKFRGFDSINLSKFESKVKNGEDNFIIIRYVIKYDYENDKVIKDALIKIPMYITPFQLKKLEEINKKLNYYDSESKVIVTNYNPFYLEKDNSIKSVEFEDEKNNLKPAIDYLKSHDRIDDYILPFYEQLVEVKKNKKRTK